MMEQGNGGTGDEAKAKTIYSQVQDLEKESKNASKKKSPLDKTVTPLRTKIRDGYEQILFLHYEFAVEKDVEQSIWKSVFYRAIEEYRKKLRKSVADGNTEMIKRVSNSFRGFLQSASTFYQQLIQKFQQKFHLVLDGSVSYVLGDDGHPPANLHRSYLSCHRCLIFLGDLARYHKDLPDANEESWKSSAKYYQQALQLVPDNGNPHNQFAVLATYMGDDFSAVYRYFRSLAVRQPFITARDNLIVLFEKIRVKMTEMQASPSTGPSKHLRQLLTSLVRLHGILFTKTSLEVFPSLKDEVLSLLVTCLKKEQGEEGYVEPAQVLKMVTVTIFSVHNVTWTPEGHTVTYVEMSQRSVLLRYAITLAYETISVLMEASQRREEYLGAVVMMTEWLRVHPDFLNRPEGDAEVKAWEKFWNVLAALANQFPRYESLLGPVPPLNHLPEETELRGFLPLHQALKSIPLPDNNAQIVDEERVLLYRKQKICDFAAFACKHFQSPRVLYYHAEMGLYSTSKLPGNSSTQPSPAAKTENSQKKSEKIEKIEKVETEEVVMTPDEVSPPPQKNVVEKNVPVHDDVEEEVILFQPGLGGITDQKVESSHTHQNEFGTIGEKPRSPPYSPSIHQQGVELFPTNTASSLFSLYPFNNTTSENNGNNSSNSNTSYWSSQIPGLSSYSLFSTSDPNVPVIERPFMPSPTSDAISNNNNNANGSPFYWMNTSSGSTLYSPLPFPFPGASTTAPAAAATAYAKPAQNLNQFRTKNPFINL